jgi:RNA polymerase sigma-70 factor (ECF subfamily)
LASAARRAHRQQRDQRRTSPTEGDSRLAKVADPYPAADEQRAAQELLVRVRQALSEDERQLADLRNEGLAWEDVAAQLGGTAQARRMQLARAVDRVARQLGLDPE